MAFLCSSVITKARDILNDSDAAGYRYSDAELIRWINDCLSAMATDKLRPDLFIAKIDHACTAGAEQACVADRVIRVVDVLGVLGGAAVLPADKASFDQFSPSWKSAAAGTAKNWMRHEDPKKFYVSPPANISQHLDLIAVQGHVALTAPADSVAIPAAFEPAIVAFVVNRAESKDDEHINSGRAAAFMSDFAGLLGVGAQ